MVIGTRAIPLTKLVLLGDVDGPDPSNFNAETLIEVIKKAPGLKSIKFLSETESNLDAVIEALAQHCPDLRRLQCPKMVSELSLAALTRNCCHLKELNLLGFAGFRKTEQNVKEAPFAMHTWYKHCQNVEKLDLSLHEEIGNKENCFDTCLDEDYIMTMLPYMPKLRSLRLSGTRFVWADKNADDANNNDEEQAKSVPLDHDKVIRAIAKFCPNLEELIIECNEDCDSGIKYDVGYDDETLIALGQGCPRLRKVIIASDEITFDADKPPKKIVTEKGLTSFANSCRSLTEFRSTAPHLITDRVALVFAQNCPYLNTLDLAEISLLARIKILQKC